MCHADGQGGRGQVGVYQGQCQLCRSAGLPRQVLQRSADEKRADYRVFDGFSSRQKCEDYCAADPECNFYVWNTGSKTRSRCQDQLLHGSALVVLGLPAEVALFAQARSKRVRGHDNYHHNHHDMSFTAGAAAFTCPGYKSQALLCGVQSRQELGYNDKHNCYNT